MEDTLLMIIHDFKALIRDNRCKVPNWTCPVWNLAPVVSYQHIISGGGPVQHPAILAKTINQPLLFQLEQVGKDGMTGKGMETGVNVGVDITDNLRNRRAFRQGFQSLYHQLFALQTVRNILGDFVLRIRDSRTVGGNDFRDVYLLKAFERIEIGQHIALWG